MSAQYLQVQKYLDLGDSYGQNQKQALKDCEKKLHRDPKNVGLSLWKSDILLRVGKRKEALENCRALCASHPTIADVDLIKVIQQTIARCQERPSSTAGTEVQKLWDNAAKTAGRKGLTRVLLEMFSDSALHDHWEDARQALLKLRREHPSESKYYFSWIVVTQLSADMNASSNPDIYKTMGALALKLVENSVHKSSTSPTATDAVKTAQELRLVCQMYRKHNRQNELLSVLDSPNIGIGSNIAKNDPEFLRIKLDLLEALQLWQELLNTCIDILRPTLVDISGADLLADDWATWRAMLKADFELKLTRTVQTLVFESRTPQTRPRNHWMACLLYCSQSGRGSLLDLCKGFFDRYADRYGCFGDIKPFVEQLNPQDQRLLQAHTSSRAYASRSDNISDEVFRSRWLTTEVNSLKLDYLTMISSMGSPAVELVTAFIMNCLRLFGLRSSCDCPAGDDACVMAVIALLRLQTANTMQAGMETQSLSQVRSLQAACLLEYLLEKYPNNRQATVMLVRVYLQLGFGSLALRRYPEIRVKEILIDSMSHVLYTRIANTHPFAAAASHTRHLDPNTRDPYLSLIAALSFYPAAIHRIQKYLGEDFHDFYYDKVFEFQEFRQGLEHSFMKQMLILERRRIARLTNRPSEDDHWWEEFKRLWRTPECLQDNRDYFTLLNIEHSAVSPSESYLWNGPKPNLYWLAVFTSAEEISALLAAKSPDPCESAQDIVHNATEEDQASLTSSERFIAEGWRRLRPAARRLVLGPQEGCDMQIQLQRMYEWAETLQSKQSPYFLLPVYRELQQAFQILDICKAYMKFCNTGLANIKQKNHELYGKMPRDMLDRISSQVQKCVHDIRQWATEGKKKLSEGGLSTLMDKVVDGPIGTVVEDLVGIGKIESYVSLYRTSAVEALDGILNVKVP